jgi:hypothetical protein
MIARYVRPSRRLDDAMARADADQIEADHEALVRAVGSGWRTLVTAGVEAGIPT